MSAGQGLREAAGSPRRAGRIVVGVDGSRQSEAALQWAARQARLTGQEVHAVMAWRAPFTTDPIAVSGIDWQENAREVLAKSVANTVGSAGDVRVVEEVVQGHPAWTLLDAAKGADLLVVGCRGHGGFAGLLLGSVSQHIAAHAECPVLVLHDHGTVNGTPAAGNEDAGNEDAGNEDAGNEDAG